MRVIRHTAIASVVVALVPGPVSACPVCAAGQSRTGWVEIALVAAMIVTPMVLAAVAGTAIRKRLRRWSRELS